MPTLSFFEIIQSMKQIFKKIGIFSIGAFIIGASFFAGLYVDASKGNVSIALNGLTKNTENVDMSLFWKAWNLLEQKHIGSTTPLTDQEKIYGAIKGLAESYGDPYTTFMDPEETKEFQSDLSGKLDGIGAVLNIKNNELTIVSPIKDSPADKAGLSAGDRIVKIGDVSTTGMSIEDAVKLIRGKKGTTVVLGIKKAGEDTVKTVSIVRDTITTPMIETKEYENDTLLIKVITFTSNVNELFRDALKDFNHKGYRHLIIDLRNNTGGYLSAAIDMSSWFVPKDKVIVTEDFGTHKDPVIYTSQGYTLFNSSMPQIIILVNENTASASEIFAAALKDYAGAKLVGQKTFGKGTVQELLDLSPKTVLKVTIARWLTSTGLSISHEGIAPDYAVDYTLEDYKSNKDPQLEKALNLIRKK